MGKAFARFFNDLGYEVLISDLRTKLKPLELVKKSDVVIVSVPIDKTEEVIKKIAGKLRPSQLIMDLTSVKEMPVREMLKGKASVIGLHPMCNDTTFGPGQKIIVCPKRAGKWMKWVKEVFEKEGGLILHKLTPKKHDEIMSMVQGLVHFAEFTFGHALKKHKIKVKDLLPFASPASSLKIEIASRLLSQNPNLYGNIQIQNENTEKVTKSLIESAEELHEIIASKDLKKFESYFGNAAKFLGDYRFKAQKESDWIIMQWLEKFNKKPACEQKKYTTKDIAVLGPENSYSSIAAIKLATKQKLKNRIVYIPTIEGVLDLVARKKVKAGIVPIENNLQGTIRETLDGLYKKNVQVRAELKMPINHCLAALSTTKITAVYSHPQGLHQCSKFLRKNHKKAELITKPSTAAAFEYVKKLKLQDAAVVGSEIAAKSYGFKILNKQIQDSEGNETTFILITHKSKSLKLATKPKKVSIAFHFSKDSSGNLHGVLGDFRDHGINLTKLESRPATHSLGDYVFFVDFEGSMKKAELALKSIKKKVAKLKVLGEY